MDDESIQGLYLDDTPPQVHSACTFPLVIYTCAPMPTLPDVFGYYCGVSAVFAVPVLEDLLLPGDCLFDLI